MPIESILRVVLVGTRNPLNIGAAARAMSNFGFSRLRVVHPFEAAFREARSAVGAAELLASAQEYQDVGEAVADCGLVVGTTAVGQRELRHSLKRLDEAGEFIRMQAGPVALLFGSEKTGLSNQALSYCHWLLRIPTCEEHISMNLGQAVAVCLYELVRHSSTVSEPLHLQSASAGELDRLTIFLTESLYASGYMKADAAPSTEEKVRRLVRRLNPAAEDAELLLGMLRQISRRDESSAEARREP